MTLNILILYSLPVMVRLLGYAVSTAADCHSFYPFFEGISEAAYDKATLDEMANKTIDYNGKPVSIYDLTQVQRAIERKIRYWKRQASALEAAGLPNAPEFAKVKQYQAYMRDFISQMNKQKEFIWYRQRVRERIN